MPDDLPDDPFEEALPERDFEKSADGDIEKLEDIRSFAREQQCALVDVRALLDVDSVNDLMLGVGALSEERAKLALPAAVFYRSPKTGRPTP